MTTKSAAELEKFNAAAQRIGHTARAIECSMVEAFATAGRAALTSAYPWSGKPPAWLPLTWTCRPDTTIGRKRRARRARGRRIEARQNIPYVGGRIWLASSTPGFRTHLLPRVMMLDEVDSFPTGKLTVEQWAAAHRTMRGQQGEAHEAHEDGR